MQDQTLVNHARYFKYVPDPVNTHNSSTNIWTITFVFVIIKTLYKDGINNFLLSFDDKPNDHIDHKRAKIN